MVSNSVDMFKNYVIKHTLESEKTCLSFYYLFEGCQTVGCKLPDNNMLAGKKKKLSPGGCGDALCNMSIILLDASFIKYVTY